MGNSFIKKITSNFLIMKIFISVKIVCLAFSLSFCSPAIQQLRSEKTIREKESQNSGEKNIAVKYFSVSIDALNDPASPYRDRYNAIYPVVNAGFNIPLFQGRLGR